MELTNCAENNLSKHEVKLANGTISDSFKETEFRRKNNYRTVNLPETTKNVLPDLLQRINFVIWVKRGVTGSTRQLGEIVIK